MSKPKFDDATSSLSSLELARIISIDEAARLSSLSKDTLARNYRDKFILLSQRRYGMRVSDALMLTADKQRKNER
jgi:hypothetical protein